MKYIKTQVFERSTKTCIITMIKQVGIDFLVQTLLI